MAFEYGGWIVWCDGAICGIGETRDAAIADAREWTEGWDGAWETSTGREQSGVFYAAPATARLLNAVRRGHANVAHFSVDGVRDLF